MYRWQFVHGVVSLCARCPKHVWHVLGCLSLVFCLLVCFSVIWLHWWHMAGLFFSVFGAFVLHLHMFCAMFLCMLLVVTGCIGFVILVWSCSVCVMFLIVITAVECCLVFWSIFGGSCICCFVRMCLIVGEL